ncbi:MAG TPA: FG-GAP-like repeat-containing protein [Terriglobales bacterium]|nr:FG-GAP-like repeat-containing protein [Terriglobales bacterium]
MSTRKRYAPAIVPLVLLTGSLFAAPLHGQQRQALSTQLAAPAGLKPVGRLPGSQPLRLALTLRLRNQGELQALLHDLYDPQSPSYRQFLTVEEFTDRFGPTVADYDRVAQFAKSNGLTVTHTAINRLVLDVSGPVSAIERAFGVTMQVYQHPTEPRTFHAPNVEPSLDPSLPVQGIEGLSDFEPPRPADLRLASPTQNATPNAAGSGPNGAFLGSDIRAAYAPGVTLDGTGQTVGILEFSTYNLSDIQMYFSRVSQPLKVPVVNAVLDDIDQFQCVNCSAGALEAALDIELAISMAPNLSGLIVYEGAYDADILNEMATDNIAKQLSCSWVWGMDAYFIDPIFQEFAAQGQNFFTASGDAGATTPLCSGLSNVCNPSRFPSVDAYVTSVGGTILTTNAAGAWQSETAWPESGGGVSSYTFPIPTYQLPLINSANQGSTTIRNYPDVAAIAQGVYFCANGGCATTGGTSASAPVWAGFLALANQQTGGSSIGSLNPSIYAIAQGTNYANDFHDITTGNNFNPASPNLYSAVAGYDLVTGLGSPNGQSLINALAPAATGPNFALSSPPGTLSISPGGQVTATITVTGVNGFSGAVGLRATFLGQLTGITASFSPASITGSGTSTLTISAANVPLHTSIPIVVTGTSGAFSHTTYLNLTALMASLVETAVSAPPASVNVGDSLSVTDTTQNNGQATAPSSVTGYYLSATTTKTINSHPLGTRIVPALAVNANSSGTVTVTVPPGLWPNTPYHLLACPNDTGTVAETVPSQCMASTASALLISPAPPQTTTTLTVTSGGASVTTVTSGTAVTLTATVLAGSTPVTQGRVNFCDASAVACADIHLLGTAQLTSAGTATLKFIPAIGSHSYKAIFAGTVSAAGSSSGASALTVTGKYPSTTMIGQSGNPGNYTLTATVTGGGPPTTGQVSFLDTSSGNSVLGAVPLAAGASALNWSNSQSVTTTAFPWDVAVGDFNGDGIPDLAIVTYNDCTVSVLLGKGDGTFTAGAKLNVACNPISIAVGDFNGDGKADLAVASDGGIPVGQTGVHFLPGTVTILLGNGDGTFTPVAAKPATSFGPRQIAVGDFNGDGKADLAIAPFEPDGITFKVTILLGNGDGTFTAAASPETPTGIKSIVIGDFNGDGKPDLAVGSEYFSFVSIFLGNGDGTFTAAPHPNLTCAPFSVVTGDFNGDGKLDLAMADAAYNTLRILLGNGDGTFTLAPGNLPTGVEPFALAAGDFNGDGKADLAVVSVASNNSTVFIGNGDGTFVQESANPATGIFPTAIVAADFTGNGTAGLAIINFDSFTATIWLPQSAATASAIVSPLGSGTHLVDANYPGDNNYNSSVSGTVALAASSLSLSPRNLTFGSLIAGTMSASQPVTLTNGGSTALAITSLVASANFSQANNCGSSVAASGSCIINVTFAPKAGGALTGTLTIIDNADGVAGSTQTVDLSGTAEDFSFGPGSGSSTSATVEPGQTATYNLSIASEGGLAGTVSFAISGAPSETTCTASPNPANFGSNVTVSCATTMPVAVLLPDRPFPPVSRWRVGLNSLWVLALVLAVWTFTRNWLGESSWRRITVALAVALLLTLSLTGCGGGALPGGGPPPNPGTPAGTYSLTVTATIGSGASTITHTVTLTLTVL